MMKSVCVLARRPDMSRADFQNYYETRHAPLGASHFPFARYVRNHLVDAPDIGFDTISEFWAEDTTKLAALMDGPIGEIMRADESRFMDRSRIAPGGAQAQSLGNGSDVVSEGRRTAVLVDWQANDATARETVLAWARKVADGNPASIDFVQSWQEPGFPAKAVLWLPAAAAVPSAPDGISARKVEVLTCEALSAAASAEQ